MAKKPIIKPYNWKAEVKKEEPPYLWYNAETGEHFRSYFTEKYYNSLMILQIK